MPYRHLSRLLAFFIALLPVCSVSYAQEKEDSVFIVGLKVVDAFFETPIDGAKVSVMDADSATVLTEELQYLKAVHCFRGMAPRRPEYVFRVQAEGYPLTYQRVVLPKKLIKSGYLYRFDGDKISINIWPELNKKLNEVSVTASRVLMVMKGDTIEYNAAAFRLAEGSMLDGLVRALPGANLDENGRITVNGDFVNTLLVNGRDFFKGDPQIALHNLPAYTVNKVQVYRKNEQAELTGRTDMTEDEKKRSPLVMDVKLKREYAKGWISNYEIGGGHNLAGSGWKWMGRLFAMRFTNHSSFALYGGSNNLNDPLEAGSKGEWKKPDVTAGVNTTHSGGIMYSLEPKDSRWTFDTDIRATRQRHIGEVETNAENYYATLSAARRSSSDNRLNTTDVKWQGTVRYKGPQFNISLHPHVTFSHAKGNDKRQSEESSTLLDRLYKRNRHELTSSRRWDMGLTAGGYYMKLVNGKPLMLDYSVCGSYNTRKRNLFETDVLSYFAPDRTGFSNLVDRTSPLWGYDLNGELFYQQPGLIERGRYTVRDEQKLWFKLSVSARYRFGQDFKREHQTMLEAEDDRFNPSVNAVRDWVLNGPNSFRTTCLNRRHSLEPNIAITSCNVTLEFNAGLNIFDRRAKDLRQDVDRRLNRTDFVFRPDLSLRWSNRGHDVTIGGSLDSELPQMYYLLDVENSADPMRIMRGNSDLRPTRNQRLYFRYNLRLKRNSQQLRVRANFNRWIDRVGMAQRYDDATGVTTYLPMNVQGNRAFDARANYTIAIGGKGNWSVSNELGMRAERSVDFNSALEGLWATSAVRNTRINEELRVDYRINSIHVGVKGSINWTRQRSEQGLFGLMKYGNGGYGVTFSMPVAWGISVDTDLMAYNRFGYGDPSMNTTDWVWNLQLQKSFGKANCFTLKATGFDILHQLSTVRREVNAQGYTETRYNSMPSYAMLSLFYRLDIKPKRIGDK